MKNYLILPIFILLFTNTYSGLVNPYGSEAIQNSIANLREKADYKFTFTLESNAPIGSELEV